MTEQEWLECADPDRMLEFLVGKASDRKLRLFAVAGCRRIWHLLVDERSRSAVETAERFAEGQATESELDEAARKADQATETALGTYSATDPACSIYRELTEYDPAQASVEAQDACTFAAGRSVDGVSYCSLAFAKSREAAKYDACIQARRTNEEIELEDLSRECFDREAAGQVGLVHDIFGNPFRPVTFDPAWLTSTVVALATAIYDERAFDRMPILADALADAGCDNSDLLNHCRQPGEHFRGCWALDLVLDKK